MLLDFAAIGLGLLVLMWSADRFVDSAASVALHFGMAPILIGMIIVGFGTSAPEMIISAISALEGAPGIALGNAYGSNISNIALILGLSALIVPITVQSDVLRKELPILTGITALAIWQVWDGEISRTDALILLLSFVMLMVWTIWEGTSKKADTLGSEIEDNLKAVDTIPFKMAMLWLAGSMVLLTASSRVMVWGAVDVAHRFGIDDMIIGLTIVSIGTSLPELASCVMAVRRGDHDIALGNVIGSNMFNTLAVVGIAGVIKPMAIGAEVLSRDMLVMGGLTLSLFIIGYGFGRVGRINRFEAATLLACYIAYNVLLVTTAL